MSTLRRFGTALSGAGLLGERHFLAALGTLRLAVGLACLSVTMCYVAESLPPWGTHDCDSSGLGCLSVSVGSHILKATSGTCGSPWNSLLHFPVVFLLHTLLD